MSTRSQITVAELIDTVHASATQFLLQVLMRDLQAQMARAEAACTDEEDMMAAGAMAYIRDLSRRLGPGAVN